MKSMSKGHFCSVFMLLNALGASWGVTEGMGTVSVPQAYDKMLRSLSYEEADKIGNGRKR